MHRSFHRSTRILYALYTIFNTVVGGVPIGVARLHGDALGVGGIEAVTCGKPALFVGRRPLPKILVIEKDEDAFS